MTEKTADQSADPSPGQSADQSVDQPLVAIALMLGAVFCFSITDVSAKWLVEDYSVFQIVFLRTVGALPPILWLIHRQGGFKALHTRHPWRHILRGVVGACAIFGFFWSYRYMSLPDAYAIFFASPLIVAALSGPMLGEKIGPRRWAAILVGFIGVLIVLRPGGDVSTKGALICVFATFSYALLMILIRLLKRTETTASVTVSFTLVMTLISAATIPFVWITPTLFDWSLFLFTGLLGGIAQILFIEALGRASAGTVAPFDYTSMVWAVLFTYLIWNEIPTATVMLGATIITASGLYIIYREHVRGQADIAHPSRRELADP